MLRVPGRESIDQSLQIGQSPKSLSKLDLTKDTWGCILNSTVRTYTCYYIMSLLYNVMLIALYVVQTFTSHQPCLTRHGHNITNGFVNAYGVGLTVIIVDTLNSNVMGIYFRHRVQNEESTFGLVTATTRNLTMTCTYIEWLLRGVILFISLGQSLLLHSKTGDYCIHQLGVLSFEGHWISGLVIMQAIKVIVFTVW